MVRLENEYLRVDVARLGAQLQSLWDKQADREYLWNGDAAFWHNRSPLLFPVIGMMRDGTYLHQGKEYVMCRHGFARDYTFRLNYPSEMPNTEQPRGCGEASGQITLIHMGKEAALTLEDNADTRELYPFSFSLESHYRLEGRRLLVEWTVRNPGEESLYFAIGGHPGFFCPPAGKRGLPEGHRSECYAKLLGAGEAGSLEALVITGQALVGAGIRELPIGRSLGQPDELLPLSKGIFAQEALLFENQIHGISLFDKDQREYIRVTGDAPIWGLWSVADDQAPFVCIEPWWGCCDSEAGSKELAEKKYINAVAPGGQWKGGYAIEIMGSAYAE